MKDNKQNTTHLENVFIQFCVNIVLNRHRHGFLKQLLEQNDLESKETLMKGLMVINPLWQTNIVFSVSFGLLICAVPLNIMYNMDADSI